MSILSSVTMVWKTCVDPLSPNLVFIALLAWCQLLQESSNDLRCSRLASPSSFRYVNAALCLREEVCRCLDTTPQAALTAFAAPQLPTAGRLDFPAPARLCEAASFESEEIEKYGNHRTERETWLALSSAGIESPIRCFK